MGSHSIDMRRGLDDNLRIKCFDSVGATKLGEPLYRGVYNKILASIQSGKYRPGERLPNQDRIASQEGVSLTTVRQAFRMLQAEGLVEIWPRRGTFVSAALIEMVGADLAGFAVDIARDAENIRVSTLSKERVRPAGWILDTLGPAMKEDLVTHIGRIHFVHDEPVMTSDYYLPFEVSRKALETSENWHYFRAFLAKTYGILTVRAHAELQAIRADSRIAELLLLPIGSPVIFARKTSFDMSGLPCECHTVHARTERWRYRVDSSLSSTV